MEMGRGYRVVMEVGAQGCGCGERRVEWDDLLTSGVGRGEVGGIEGLGTRWIWQVDDRRFGGSSVLERWCVAIAVRKVGSSGEFRGWAQSGVDVDKVGWWLVGCVYPDCSWSIRDRVELT